MGHYEKTFSFAVDDDVDDATKGVREFLELNGYSLNDEGDHRLIAKRGKPGASWFSSDMSRLETQLTIEFDGNQVDLDYRVTVTGQHLTDEDRQFWEREAQAIERATNREEPAVDLRPEEAERAKQVTGEYRSTAVWAAFIVFAMIIVFGLVADRLGIL